MKNSAAWQKLLVHRDAVVSQNMRDLFAADPQRFSRLSLQLDGMLIDYSKHRVTGETMALLFELAREARVAERAAAMVSGEKINSTENRAALHTALRNRANAPVMLDGHDVMPDINRVLAHMGRFSDAVRSGAWLGHTGKPITDIVNIGIGGSDLGPHMVCEALRPYGHPRLTAHFVSNVDASHLFDTLKRITPESTLFIIASKTFTTQETLANAHTARRWFLRNADDAAIAKHFVAVSTNASAVGEFGIDTANMFEFWDWVGGRYSLWSAIGLSIMLFIGPERFGELLVGAHEMDRHFLSASAEKNAPLILALLGLWYNNFLGAESHAVIPYDQHMHRLPAYLQQLDMESNGKAVTRDGNAVDGATGSIIWGEPGTNSQHAFFQLLHQGTRLVPVDFIAAIRPHHREGEHQTMLLANCLAQSQALMRGKTAAEAHVEMLAQGLSTEAISALLPHKVFSGNRPSTTILLDELTPRILGMLIALYEHKVFAQGILWNVNSFDQWGVELGKQLAGRILGDLQGESIVGEHDVSTASLIDHVRSRRTK